MSTFFSSSSLNDMLLIVWGRAVGEMDVVGERKAGKGEDDRVQGGDHREKGDRR